MKSRTGLAQPMPTNVTQIACHRPITVPTARPVLMGLMCRMSFLLCRGVAASMCHHERDRTGSEKLTSHAAEQELAGAAVAVAAHHDVLRAQPDRSLD